MIASHLYTAACIQLLQDAEKQARKAGTDCLAFGSLDTLARSPSWVADSRVSPNRTAAAAYCHRSVGLGLATIDGMIWKATLQAQSYTELQVLLTAMTVEQRNQQLCAAHYTGPGDKQTALHKYHPLSYASCVFQSTR